jgi:hypothetical protein
MQVGAIDQIGEIGMFERQNALRIPGVATALIALMALSAGAQATVERSNLDNKDLCAAAVSAQEARSGIPKRLLTAISLVESSRWDAGSGKSVAWPWTVTAEGKGRFFPTKAAAIAAVRRLQAQGVDSIDVGCMQVNLHYHPKAFTSLNEAFDPERNAAYGAKFLTDLKRDHGSWQRAVQHYHSSTAERRIPYQQKVYAAWRVAAAAADAPATPSDTARMRRIGKQIERDNRARLSAFQRRQRQEKVAAAEAPGSDDPGVMRFLSSWPPRDARAQLRTQSLARAWAMNGAGRGVRP